MATNPKDFHAGEIRLIRKTASHTTPAEVIIPITPNEEQKIADSQSAAYAEADYRQIPIDLSPEIIKSSPSPNTPLNIPVERGLIRRRTIKSKPKSRFGEPSVPIDSAVQGDNYPVPQSLGLYRASSSLTNGSQASSRAASFAQKSMTPGAGGKGEAKEGPDEKEIYNKITAQLSARKQKRMTVKLIIQLAVFLCILACLVSSLVVEKYKFTVFYGLAVWKWFLLVMVIFSGMLVTCWIINLIVFLIEWKFILKKNVVYFTHGLKTIVQVFVWLSVVLGTWVLLFNPDVDVSPKTRKFLDFVTWTMISALIGSFLWLIKTTMLKIVASSFHLRRFFDRIQESLFHHYVLQTLSGLPVVENAQRISRDDGHESHDGQASFTEQGKLHKEKKVVDIRKVHQMKQERIPAWTMQLLVNIVQNSGLSTMSGMLNEKMVEGGVELDDDEITSEEAAIAAAVRIFNNVVKDKDEFQYYIDKDDLHKFLIDEEVDLVFPWFEMNEKGHITLTAFAKWVVRVYKDRQTLQHALNDNKTAVKQLGKLLAAIIIVATLVIWLLLTDVVTTRLLIVFSSQLLVAGFIFSNTCRTIFEAIIFVFVMHPFDVGDRCVIDGAKMIVEEMNILTTVFLKFDNEKVYYPNSVLATKAIGNYYRSPDQTDSFDFAIDFYTPLGKIADLKDRIKKYLDENPHRWHPDHNLAVKEIENVNKIKMTLFFNHTMNFQDYPEKIRRRSELVLEMKKIFEDLGIKYNLLPQDVHLRNVGSATRN